MQLVKKKRLSVPLTCALIEELGGVSKSARELEVFSPAICSWKKNGLPYVYVQLVRAKYPFLPSVKKTFLDENFQ